MALICAFVAAPDALAQSGFQKTVHASVSGGSTQQVKLGLSKSLIVELPRAASDVLVSDPETADAVVRSSRRAYVIGKKVGQTNIFFFDANGQQILSLEVQVERDIGVLERTIGSLIPGSSIRAEPINDNVILSGTVRNPGDAKTAADIAARFVGDAEHVVSMIQVSGSEQVYLKVTVAEMERKTIKQLGINITASVANNATTFAALTQNPFGVTGQAISNTAMSVGYSNKGDSVSGTLRALEERGLSRTLAEPTLSAISGEKASFLAGGEFPVPTGRDSEGNIQIEFKPFGVVLDFMPVVISQGRISLTVKTEVSELTSDGAFTLLSANGAGNDLTIPALKVRRADTTIELPSGGALAIAGLIQDETKQAINGVPGLMDLPVLGTLFRSRDFQRSETELVIIVTPYTVKAVSPEEMSRPTDGVVEAGDPSAILLGRLNRIYSVNGGAKPIGRFTGQYGFIYD
ncbi:MAG: type II and III secretion system protein family protein [Rhodobiaceae bacterium]|nr:type II and III secretion system protein family protein [Rhodobiaceae bacterium]